MRNSLLRGEGVNKRKWVVKFWRICNRLSPSPLQLIALPKLLRVGDASKIFQANLEDFDHLMRRRYI